MSVAQTLHQHVNASASAATSRIQELGFLAQLLEGIPQRPDRLPYVERQFYDERRSHESPASPSSASLVRRYGSWARAAHAAFGMLADGRNAMGGFPWPLAVPGKASPPKYTAEECLRSIQECAEAIGHVPSSAEYHRWQLAVKRIARTAGRTARLAPPSVIVRELAPDRNPGGGWSIALKRAGFP
jgi:hypothetical protein